MCALASTASMVRRSRPKWKITQKQICLRVGVVALLSLTLSIGSIALLERTRSAVNSKHKISTRVAFGSGTSFDYRSQPVWVHGVIPSKPDAWIWLGDMAYLDKPRINCDAMPWHQQCNCSNDWLHQSHHSCMAGNVDFASSRVEVQLSNPDYAQFLAFMCPGHRSKGLHPPTGSDPAICPRQILGTYDDHDYGWNHGNKRLPQKDKLKQVFLDAIGEPGGSSRRGLGHGIEWKYTLNEGKSSQEIDVYLLDERYYRDTLPCHIRKSFCEKVALTDVQHPKHGWCLDFLRGGESHVGSCCKKDDQILYGWCLQSSNKDHPLWENVCNPKSPMFGHDGSKFDQVLSTLDANWTEDHDSSFCEILGPRQRSWLEDTILQSYAPIKLVVSSSVVVGNPLKKTCEDMGVTTRDIECPCTGEDWECYKPAQLHLLNLLSRSHGCVILLTGDFQYSDIRVLKQGEQEYKKYYGDIKFRYPLYQVMASGLSMNAEMNFTCDVLRRDPLRLRDHPECDFVRAPSFGMIEVEWERDPVIKVQIRDGMTGIVKLESRLTLSSCLPKQREYGRKNSFY